MHTQGQMKNRGEKGGAHTHTQTHTHTTRRRAPRLNDTQDVHTNIKSHQLGTLFPLIQFLKAEMGKKEFHRTFRGEAVLFYGGKGVCTCMLSRTQHQCSKMVVLIDASCTSQADKKSIGRGEETKRHTRKDKHTYIYRNTEHTNNKSTSRNLSALFGCFFPPKHTFMGHDSGADGPEKKPPNTATKKESFPLTKFTDTISLSMENEAKRTKERTTCNILERGEKPVGLPYWVE